VVAAGSFLVAILVHVPRCAGKCHFLGGVPVREKTVGLAALAVVEFEVAATPIGLAVAVKKHYPVGPRVVDCVSSVVAAESADV